jgi:hypothetical protein
LRRYIVDSQVDFEEHEVSLLLRALQASSCEKRADFFEHVRGVRRRPKVVNTSDR